MSNMIVNFAIHLVSSNQLAALPPSVRCPYYLSCPFLFNINDENPFRLLLIWQSLWTHSRVSSSSGHFMLLNSGWIRMTRDLRFFLILLSVQTLYSDHSLTLLRIEASVSVKFSIGLLRRILHILKFINRKDLLFLR